MHLLHDKELMHQLHEAQDSENWNVRWHQKFSIFFYHAYIMQMEGIAKWLLPLFDSELFG